MKTYKTFTFFCLFIFSLNGLAFSKKLDAELEDYKNSFNQSNKILQIDTAKKLEWSGFSDTTLFDLIEQKLIMGHESPEKKSKLDLDYLSWMSKALAFSGQPKYIPTLTQVTDETTHKKLRKYARQSLKILPQYNEWNKVILSEAKWNNELSNNINRFTSMIRSNEPQLIILASKRIHYTHEYNEDLLDTVEQELLKRYQETETREKIQAWSWAMKAISGARQEKHKKTIQTISESAKNKKLRKYAKKYLQYY